MALDENTYHDIDSFLRGELSGAELAAFVKRMETDEELRAETEWMKSMNTAMKDSGRKILKAQIALAMNVPASSLTKYVPAKNKISFFKKWWWAFAIATVLAAAAAWYFIPHQQKEQGPESKQVSDSCVDEACTDSTLKPTSTGDTAAPFGDSARYDATTGSLFGSDTSGCLTRVVKFNSYNQIRSGFESASDTSNRLVASAYSWNANSTFSVSFCPKNQQQEYTFGSSLQLYSDYADSTGLRFYLNGADILMADNNGNVWQFSKTDKLKPFFLMESHHGASKPKAPKQQVQYSSQGK